MLKFILGYTINSTDNFKKLEIIAIRWIARYSAFIQPAPKLSFWIYWMKIKFNENILQAGAHYGIFI
jgi:hypothetical protein